MGGIRTALLILIRTKPIEVDDLPTWEANTRRMAGSATGVEETLQEPAL
jgi:hypothetical protein